MVPFAILGAAFKVMVLIEGFTEVRPANAIPMVSGYLFGPFGALGCALGNLIADSRLGNMKLFRCLIEIQRFSNLHEAFNLCTIHFTSFPDHSFGCIPALHPTTKE